MKFLKLRIPAIIFSILCSLPGKTQVFYPGLSNDARDAMKKAASFYYEKISAHGGYVYYYSLDLQQRWGEGRATPDMIFVQSPGTPSVGMSYLKAYRATDDTFYLKAARDAAMALVNGQLESGGWTQVIYFTRPEKDRMGRYRKMQGGDWNYSSLDDGQTPAALKMLMLTDQTLEFRDSAIHEAVIFGLNALLEAQFPNGAFPQVWQGPVKQMPVVSAKFPDYNWKTEGLLKDYWNYYNLNDNIA